MSLTHFDEAGRARMVDVGDKEETHRVAVARGRVLMLPETLATIVEGRAKKGDVLGVAQVAGIMAAKRTHRADPDVPPARPDSGQRRADAKCERTTPSRSKRAVKREAEPASRWRHSLPSASRR